VSVLSAHRTANDATFQETFLAAISIAILNTDYNTVNFAFQTAFWSTFTFTHYQTFSFANQDSHEPTVNSPIPSTNSTTKWTTCRATQQPAFKISANPPK
jgi:hypothetical protein